VNPESHVEYPVKKLIKRRDEMNKNVLAVFLTGAVLMSSAVAAFANDHHGRGVAGAVYIMTNAADGNQVIVYERDRDGLLTMSGAVSTQGAGSGVDLDPLASQNALVLTRNNRWLLAVNAGSNEISVFRVGRRGLNLADKVDSGGEFPVSLAVFDNLVYVLNAGGTPNITGFFLSHRGRLIPRSPAARDLGPGGYSQVDFDPRGDNLVVTDRADNEILVFPVNERGLPAMSPVTSASAGIAPFGFIFDRHGDLLVAEAGSGAVSSYDIKRDGSLEVITPSVENGQAATCWIAGNHQGDVFTSNTGSQTISAYSVSNGHGRLALLDPTAGFGNRPIDMNISIDGRFLYALDPAEEAVDMFEIESDGSLTGLGTAPAGISIFAQGIAVR
jgi:6-phosphogluconolactonase (cycloisomerase 2 family)